MPIRLSADFSTNVAGQKGVARYIQTPERENLQPQILYPARLSFRIEGEVKNFSDKKN